MAYVGCPSLTSRVRLQDPKAPNDRIARDTLSHFAGKRALAGSARMKAIWVIGVVFLVGCPPVNSKPCAADDECSVDQRCRRGACGPICLEDTDCGEAQVCRGGLCAARPECSVDTDCASGFSCTADRCQCLSDASCGSNQQCTGGACVTRERCTADADCVGQGGRCEVTQGLCLPACGTSIDCAPQLDPQVATALYACIDRSCLRRCVNDLTCGGQGIICASNLCRAADCKTFADCADGQYCTSATFGRCSTYSTCTDSSSCQRNFQCKRFETTACPPGFDCAQKLCLELPQCLADSDCATGVPGTPSYQQTGFCTEGHCQASGACVDPSECGPGLTCVAKICVPSACRGHGDCTDGKACVDGSCITAPTPAQINVLRVLPTHGLLVVGDTLQLHLIAYRLDGSSFPLAAGVFSVVDSDGDGGTSTRASVSAQGLVTALDAGEVIIRAQVTGSTLAAVEASVTIVPALVVGRRVVVVDAANKQPLALARVMGCEQSDCAAPTQVLTDAQGVASFALLGPGPASFTVVSAEVRSDGLPTFERASVIGTRSADVYLPLRANPTRASAGFNASVAFTKVSTNGTYWAGFVASSFGDVPSVRPSELLGDTFSVRIDTINQRIPVPGAVVLYTSPAFGFPQEVKPRSFGFSQPGTQSGRSRTTFSNQTAACAWSPVSNQVRPTWYCASASSGACAINSR